VTRSWMVLTRWACLVTSAAGLTLVVLGAFALVRPMGVSASSATLTLTPDSSFHDGESISVKVGPNSIFTPHSKVNILECADPDGKTSNLPKDISSCDGNTIQASTVLVAANGSFSVSSYTLYQLPSEELGELSTGVPACDSTHECVLYVGQNQNDFTAPKIFSPPFFIAASGPQSGTPTSTSTTSTTPVAANGSSVGATTVPAAGSTPTTSTSTTSADNASVSNTPAAPVTSASTDPVTAAGVLPNTGVPATVPWFLAIGVALMASGSLGRRLSLRGIR